MRRCAIYTRKSSEEGLDQAFNSLHAQREACEAYILSQAGEGWAASPTIYDDGGFSGGNIDRPALRRLLVDIADGKVDIVVVYKVDRLTRSLGDFAKIVDAFDQKGISFVSVTQAFNTTTSMGRLTLNVLLSFAQFEREVTGERIRDKISASKAKGIWMGGVVALGYDAVDRALIVNPAEAEQVRAIFRLYLETKSVPALRTELKRLGLRSKAWTTQKGRSVESTDFSHGALFHMLRNRLYLGEIVHKGVSHPGQHVPVVDPNLFDAVQNQLSENRRSRRERPLRSASSPLAGRIFDAEDAPMCPTFAYSSQKRIYRYYVSATVLPRSDRAPGLPDCVHRISAQAVETLVMAKLRQLTGIETASWESDLGTVERVELRTTAIHILFCGTRLAARCGDHPSALPELLKRLPPADQGFLEHEGKRTTVRVVLPMRPKLRGGRTWQIDPKNFTPSRPRPNKQLIQALKRAHRALKQLNGSLLADGNDLSRAEAPSDFYTRKILPLAFLAPDIQRAILAGRQPAGLTIESILGPGIPLAWASQRSKLGFVDVGPC